MNRLLKRVEEARAKLEGMGVVAPPTPVPKTETMDEINGTIDTLFAHHNWYKTTIKAQTEKVTDPRALVQYE